MIMVMLKIEKNCITTTMATMKIATASTTLTIIMTMVANDKKQNNDNIDDNNCRRMDELAAQGGLNSRYGQHP